MRGSAMGILVSTGRNVSSPLDAGPWRIYDSGAEKWVIDPYVTITPTKPGAAPR